MQRLAVVRIAAEGRSGRARGSGLVGRAAKVVLASLWMLAVMPGVAQAEEITTEAQAASRAQAIAAADGDPEATIEVGAGSLPMEATGPNSLTEMQYDPATSYKVRLTGHFTLDVSTPPGDPAPTGEEMEIVISKSNGAVTSLWLKPPETTAGPSTRPDPTPTPRARRAHHRKAQNRRAARRDHNCKARSSERQPLCRTVRRPRNQRLAATTSAQPPRAAAAPSGASVG